MVPVNDLAAAYMPYINSSYGTYADAKSLTGTVVMLKEAPVYFKSSKQKIVTQSSTEAELVGRGSQTLSFTDTVDKRIYVISGLQDGPSDASCLQQEKY